jgi:hypothetical protein
VDTEMAGSAPGRAYRSTLDAPSVVTQTAMMTAAAARHLPRTRERGRRGVAIRDILQASGAVNTRPVTVVDLPRPARPARAADGVRGDADMSGADRRTR